MPAACTDFAMHHPSPHRLIGVPRMAQVDLMIALGPDYPDSESSLTLSVLPVVGLEKEQLAELEKQLRAKIKELVGREMVFDLAQTAQDFLRKYNVDPKKSIHDEMMEQQQRQQQEMELAAREKAAQERDEAVALHRQQEALRLVELQEERQRRRKLYKIRRKTDQQGAISEGMGMWGSSDDDDWSGSDDGDDEEEAGEDEERWPQLASSSTSARQEANGGASVEEPAHEPDPEPANPDKAGASPSGAASAQAESTSKLRWKRMERMESTGDGVVVMAPELLGKGRFGAVYMAMCESNLPGKHPRPGAFFAVKEMGLRGGSSRQGQIEKMMAEVTCQSKVDHPNVVKVFVCCVGVSVCLCLSLSASVCLTSYLTRAEYRHARTHAHALTHSHTGVWVGHGHRRVPHLPRVRAAGQRRQHAPRYDEARRGGGASLHPPPPLRCGMPPHQRHRAPRHQARKPPPCCQWRA